MAQIFKNNFYTGDEYLTTELEQNLLDSNNEKDMRNKLNFFRSSIIDLLTPEQVTEFIQAENKFIAQDSGILSELKKALLLELVLPKISRMKQKKHLEHSILDLQLNLSRYSHCAPHNGYGQFQLSKDLIISQEMPTKIPLAAKLGTYLSL